VWTRAAWGGREVVWGSWRFEGRAGGGGRQPASLPTWRGVGTRRRPSLRLPLRKVCVQGRIRLALAGGPALRLHGSLALDVLRFFAAAGLARFDLRPGLPQP